MRARNLKPALFKNELLGHADPIYTLLFEGLWCEADREGRLEDRPLRLRAEIFPYRGTFDIDAGLAWLLEQGFIDRYEAGGVRVIQVLKFLEHQRPHSSEAASALPAKVSRPGKAVRKSGEPKLTGRHTKVNLTAHLLQPHNALIPDPLLLTPDSGLLTPDTLVCVGGTDPPRKTFLEIQRRYPAGLHRGDHWLLAEREVYQRLDAGVPAAALLEAADAYRAQQEASGTIGSGKVMRPSNFFAGDIGPWRGPFPLPATKADTRLNANIDAAAEFMRRTEAS